MKKKHQLTCDAGHKWDGPPEGGSAPRWCPEHALVFAMLPGWEMVGRDLYESPDQVWRISTLTLSIVPISESVILSRRGRLDPDIVSPYPESVSYYPESLHSTVEQAIQRVRDIAQWLRDGQAETKTSP